jgi:hypothetical protein
VALNQAAIDSNQIHINVQTSYQTIDFEAGQLARDAAEAVGWCQGTVPVSLTTACPRLLEGRTEFAKRISALRTAFTELERVWQTERKEQEAIVAASQRLQ